MHFQATIIKSLKKIFFNVWSGSKRVFMHLHILPDHQNQVIKKLFFSPLEWLKTCFDAFTDHQNQVLKKLFFLPLEWLKTCFDAFPDHQNQVPHILFFHIQSGSKRVFMHLRILPDHKIMSLKKCFFTSGVVNNVF